MLVAVNAAGMMDGFFAGQSESRWAAQGGSSPSHFLPSQRRKIWVSRIVYRCSMFHCSAMAFTRAKVLYQLSLCTDTTVAEEVFAPASSQPRSMRWNARRSYEQKPSSHKVMFERSVSRLSRARLQRTSLI